MSIPQWLLTTVAWIVVVLGALTTVAALVLAAYAICNEAFKSGKFTWSYIWHVRWLHNRLGEEPTLAKMFESMKARAEQAESNVDEARRESEQYRQERDEARRKLRVLQAEAMDREGL